MKKSQLQRLAASLILLAQLAFSQNVKLENVTLGMNRAEVKAALVPSAPYYVNQYSEIAKLHSLVVESDAKPFAFTFIDGRVVDFSLMHILPSGQRSFLPPSQEPTVTALRKLATRRTWTPAQIKKGDTLRLSDATAIPLQIDRVSDEAVS